MSQSVSQTATLDGKPAAARRPNGLPGAFRLLGRSLRDFAAQWYVYMLVIATVTLPANLLGLIPGLGPDKGFQAYVLIATVFMNVALLHVVLNPLNGARLRLGEVYYNSSAAILRFIVVSFVLAVMLTPAVIGISALTVGLIGQAGSAAEVVIISTIGLVFIVLSLWLLTRFALAAILVVAGDTRPLAALGAARRLTLGRFWAVLGRQLLILLFCLLAGILLLIPVVLLAANLNGPLDLLLTLAGSIFTLTALPIANIYLVKLYQALQGQN